MAMPCKLKSLLICTTIFLLTACGDSGPIEPPLVEIVKTFDDQEQVDKTVSNTLAGILLLADKPENKFIGSAGLANKETQEPMQVYHTMSTASAGKPLIALHAAMLADETLLNLDDPLHTCLSDDILNQIENSNEITLRQLLNHTSGIYDFVENDDILNTLLAEPDKLKKDIDFVALGLKQPEYFKPGESYHYSNTVYLLVGLILDQVLGMHHSVALKERILVPLGLNVTKS